jgi:hypothetical protein
MNLYDVHASVITENGHFKIQASYEVPIDMCAAYAFITDYEAAKKISQEFLSQKSYRGLAIK